MGIIISGQESLDSTRFTALKRGQIHKAESVLLLERAGGGTGPTAAIVKLASGQFTVIGMRHTPNGNWAMLGYGAEHGHKSVLSALVKMGAITQAEMAAHCAAVAEREERESLESARLSLARACLRLGIPVPSVPTSAAA